MPWSVLPLRNIVLSGLHAEAAGYGKPGLLTITLNSAMALFFLLPFIWAKRTNVFIAALNIAWSIRNYILLTACNAGECPQKKIAVYLLIILSFAILLCTFLPKIQAKRK